MRLDYVQSDMRTNRVALTSTSDKKVTDEKIAAAIGNIGNGLDKFGNEHVNAEEIALSAVTSSSANPLLAGGDVASSVRDLKVLLPDEEDEDDEEEDEDDADQPPGHTPIDKPSTKGKWWPREAFVVKKEAEMQGLIAKEEKALKEQRDLLVRDVQVACARLLVGRWRLFVSCV